MAAVLLAFVEAFVDAMPAILPELISLVGRKQQQYTSVLASVEGETAAGVAELEARK